ncbi:MAG TPA: phenylalanine--tRNA ligase subunit beta [Acidimicrobiales bacterium]|nr:phenylalanine--tRNA ligase subunit beta [Acidimicrobiales bacterium]
MRAPLSWLRDYAPLDASVDRLTAVLSELGLVVDGVEQVGEGLGDVVVAKVLGIRPHPDADRIRLVDVDPGDGGPLQIVCGAWNFSVGDLVPLAPVGATLPGGFQIGRRKMRGEVSNGMLCSARELELPETEGGADGLLVLAPDLAPPGTPITEALGIEADVVFDLDITPNRPDALSMAGVARDLAAALGETWSAPSEPKAPPIDEALPAAKVSVTSGELCPRFTGTLLEGAPDGPSTPEIARRLTLAGMRPINAVVDVSNYVMLDIGQPNHAYDLEQLGGEGILVRTAEPGETLETLDGVERSLEPSDCVICDADGSPVGLGGIMGGARAEIGPTTRRVLLECAWFEPGAIARTGNRVGLHSEARARFERGVDPELASVAVERFCALLSAMPGGGKLRRGPTSDVRHPSLPAAPRIELRPARVNSLLGTDLDRQQIADLLTPLGFEVAVTEGTYQVVVPTWRLEVTREIDLVEEVARMWGYQRIDRTVPAGARSRTGGLTAFQKERRRIKAILSGAGLDEAWTTTFIAPGDLARAGLDPEAVEVENPLDRSESLLRTSLIPGLLKALRFNVDRQLDDLALFEVGRVFAPPAPDAEEQRPVESELIGVALLPPADGPSPTGTAAVESAVRVWQWLAAGLRLQAPAITASAVPGLHPGRAATVSAGGTELGAVGEIDPGVVAAYGLPGAVGWLGLSLDALSAAPRRDRTAVEPSRFPASDIDLAFVLADDVPAAELVATMEQAAGDLVEGVSLFDVYRGERIGAGRRSLALRARLRAADRTLTDGELAAARQKMIDAGAALGAELRA